MGQPYTRCLLGFIVILFLIIMTVDARILAYDSSTLFDFSDQPNSKEFYTDLDGEWYFFKEVLLNPHEVKDQVGNEMGTIVSLPSSFEAQTGEINSFGTYHTTIKIPEKYIGETLAIHVPYQYSAYTLFVNQIEIAKNGVVGQGAASHTAEMAPKTGYFIAESDEVSLTMQVSSFDHIRGGFENSVYLGEASIVVQKFNTNMIGSLFINGCIFMIGLFMILFAWYRRHEHLFLIFGMFAMFISARALFAVPFYYTLIFLDLSWLWGTRLEYILTEASSMFYVILLWKWHEKEFSKKIMYGLTVIHLALIVTTLFTQPVFFQTLFFNVFYLAIPTFFYVIYVIYRSIRNHNKYAKTNLIGIGLIFIAFFNDFAIGQNWYQSWTLMLPAVGVYVMIHVILMSKNFAESVKKTEQLNKQLMDLNKTLDDEVHSQTIKLRHANKRLKKIASIDHLTGIYNRRSFNEFIARIFKGSSEKNQPLSLLMLDLDEFKKYNDYYGHVGGDRLLRKVVEIVRKILPEDSFFARYGGEEFVIVLPNRPQEVAYQIAHQIRKSVEQSSLEHLMSQSEIVTLSIGVATRGNQTSFQSELELIRAADQRLYQSKQAGRNQVT